MDPAMAREWEQSFEDKSISELEALEPPSGMYAHFFKRWQAARLAAIEARKAALKSARQPLVNQIAARAGQFSALPAASAAQTPPVEMPVPNEEQKIEFNSFDRAENLRQRIAAAIARNDAPVPVAPSVAPVGEIAATFVLPSGDAAQLLEHQLATSAGLIDYLAKYIARNDTSPAVCANFMDRMSAMIGKSAQAGKVIGQLRGQVSRSRQEIAVSHAEGGRGAG